VELKEAAGKPATIGTRTGSEAGSGRSACWKARNPILIKTLHVEPDGPRGKLRSLPGETSCVRAREESAEVVVALRAAERRQERRTEGTNSSALRSIVSRGRIRPEVSRPQPPGWLCASPLRSSDAVAAGGAESGIPGDTHEPRTDSNAGGLVGIPSGLARLNPRWCSTAGCGKPHVRWCGSPGGRNPARATRSLLGRRQGRDGLASVPGMGLN
jgi:hypothetical protein